MNKQALSSLTLEELQQRRRMLTAFVGVFIGVLLALAGLNLYIGLQKGFTPLSVIPVALLPIAILNITTLKKIKAEIQGRLQK